MELEILRKQFERCISEQDYFDLSDEMQSLGLRACPLNIKYDDIARDICKNNLSICAFSCGATNNNRCRNHFVTCWKEYFKFKQNQTTNKSIKCGVSKNE